MSKFCGSCERLYLPRPSQQVGVARAAGSRASTDYPSPVHVGIGNPGVSHTGARHNVGQRMLDVLAARPKAEWCAVDGGLVATGQLDDRAITLFKPNAYVNLSGPVIECFIRSIGRSREECVIVIDDTDLPLGTVRRRASGGDGGHKGMRSVIAEFGTQRIHHRIRVGVRPPLSTLPAKELVLSVFDRGEKDVLTQAIPAFTNAVLEAASEIDVARRALDESEAALDSK